MKSYLNKRIIAISVTLLAAGLAWIWFSRIPENSRSIYSIQAPQVGFTAPDFTLSTLDSQEIKMSDLRGNPVILNFWASWCPPCKAEMPDFQDAFKEYSGTGLEILAVNAASQDTLANVTLFIEQHSITIPILLDKDGSAIRDYQVHSLPTTFFIDKDGVIKEVIIGGPIPLSLLRIQANQLLTD